MRGGLETSFSTFSTVLSSILGSSGAILDSITVNMHSEISMVVNPLPSSFFSLLLLSLRFMAVRMVCRMPHVRCVG